MSTQTITEFLEARIGEDERDAYDLLGEREGDRRLAESAAKRAIIERHDKFYATRRANWMNPNYVGAMEELGWTVRTLAAVYADHADYQQEWDL